MKGLRSWDAAVKWLTSAAEVQNKVEEKNVQIDSRYGTLANPITVKIISAAANHAESLGEPELTQRYLTHLRVLESRN